MKNVLDDIMYNHCRIKFFEEIENQVQMCTVQLYKE